MTIKEITCFETEDGRIWKTIAQAEEWHKIILKSRQVSLKSEPVYNMRNEGYENHYHPVGRD